MGREGVKVEVEGGEGAGSTIGDLMAVVEDLIKGEGDLMAEDLIRVEEVLTVVEEEDLIKVEEVLTVVEEEDLIKEEEGLTVVEEEALHSITTLVEEIFKTRGENLLMFQLMEDNGVNNKIDRF